MVRRLMGMVLLLTLVLSAAGAYAGGRQALPVQTTAAPSVEMDEELWATPVPNMEQNEVAGSVSGNASRGGMHTWIYGGSGSDVLSEMAVSVDGRIVMTGYTDSHDGTLSSRTKQGRSGWTLCVDGDGEVLWSFCSRLGVHDTMSHPVFHEDGSVTVLLEAEMGGVQEIEMISLSREGSVNWRKTLLKTDGHFIKPLSWRTEQGVVLANGTTSRGMAKETLRFLWDGERDEAFAADLQGVRCAAGDYAVKIVSDAGWFGRLDAQGGFTPMARAFAMEPEDQFLYGDVHQLLVDGGGAVGCGDMVTDPDGERTRVGRIMRWNALGQVAFDRIVDCGPLSSIARIPGGYAAMAHTYEVSYGSTVDWTLMVFDEQGNVTDSRVLDQQSPTLTCPIAALPDGSIAVLSTVRNGKNHSDAQLMRFRP